jgi:hypothetical protein
MKTIRLPWLAPMALLTLSGRASADFPLMNMVADIQKQDSSRCDQLWAQQQPTSEQ